jgi:Xaa-Pro aminopeptidase
MHDGNGTNIDGFETPDSRRLLPGTCFSIEPGVYLPGNSACAASSTRLLTERRSL